MVLDLAAPNRESNSSHYQQQTEGAAGNSDSEGGEVDKPADDAEGNAGELGAKHSTTLPGQSATTEGDEVDEDDDEDEEEVHEEHAAEVMMNRNASLSLGTLKVSRGLGRLVRESLIGAGCISPALPMSRR